MHNLLDWYIISKCTYSKNKFASFFNNCRVLRQSLRGKKICMTNESARSSFETMTSCVTSVNNFQSTERF